MTGEGNASHAARPGGADRAAQGTRGIPKSDAFPSPLAPDTLEWIEARVRKLRNDCDDILQTLASIRLSRTVSERWQREQGK